MGSSDPAPGVPFPPADAIAALRRGLVIPAHPLALDAGRRLDERRQRALTRYYIDAGAGGVAVGVHTTQFAIRDPSVGLLEPVLALAAETVRAWPAARARPIVLAAGICGPTRQAIAEASLAARLGYHTGLLSLSALREASDDDLIAHARAVAEVIPLFGFYLQSAVGGRKLGYAFWRRFAEIPNVVAIKVAPFDRYDTIDVARGVIDAGRAGEVALYTGNDDAIVLDLLSAFGSGADPEARFAGGLLGHWAFWTRRAVELFDRIRAVVRKGAPIPPELLRLAGQITDANAAVFDPHNGFAGCIPGIHEILRRQRILCGRWCLDPAEDLSPGQAEEIDRVCAAYPHLADDAFVAEHLDRWLA
ncbi:MAG: dihydrodipicolinate synthase family protein [Planctomycetes bacterium]|nr:dihydrodipicolinate synthase family protein [Planctomycetota bacterium]